MNAKDAHPLSDLRWHRLSATVMNIRSLPAMSAHPFSVFQAIMKGVSLLPVSPSAAALLPNKESPAASACPRPAPAPLMGNESPELTGDLSPVPGEERTGGAEGDAEPLPRETSPAGETQHGETDGESPRGKKGEEAREPLIIFHARGRRHSLKMREYEKVSLDIFFFRKGHGYVRQWRDAFQAYLSDPVTGRNFEVVTLGDVEERSFGQLAGEADNLPDEGEICLEFLTPFPFKPEKGKARTYLARTAFIRSLEKRFSRLFGREIVYRGQDDRFSLLPYYWNYTEIRHSSLSQPGQTQYINGCVGKLYIKGCFRDFLPFLLLGSEVHAGTKLSNSQGYYLLHKESPGYFQSFFPNKKIIVSVIRDVINRYDHALQALSETEKYPFDENQYAENLFQLIVSNGYLPTPHIAFTIKKKSGVDRVVEQLSFRDLIVQQYLLKVISTVFDRFFEAESIGFRKGVSRQRSIGMIQSAIAEGYQCVIESDIEDFFPSVDLDILEHLLDCSIPQNDVCLKNILLKLIRNGFILNGTYYERRKGLAQGGPLSPILANLYLDSFDEQIKRWGLASHDEDAGTDHAKGGAGNKTAGGNASRGVKLIRYADDFIILTRTKEEAEGVLSDTESYLSTLGLKIKKEKTAIRSLRDGFHFLGIRFERSAVLVEGEDDVKLLRKPLYIVEPYLFLSLNGDAVDLCKNRKVVETIPLRRISEIMVMEKTVFSTALLRKCTEGNIPLTIALGSGYYITTVKPDSKKYYDVSYEHGRKYYSLSETELLCIAKEFAAGKLQNYLALFQQRFRKEQYRFIGELEGVICQMHQAGDVAQVRGLEGAAAKKIYQRLNNFIDDDAFALQKRDRRSPDRMNSLLNLGYYLLFSRINATVRAVGLNPYLGFLHSPQDNYESLVCDIEELFRARIDRFIIRLINLKVVGREDFVETERGLHLEKDAVRKFIDQFESEMEKKGAQGTLSMKEDLYVQTIVLKKWALENGSLSFYRWKI